MPSTVVIPTASGRIVARPRKNSSESSSSTGKASSLGAAEILGDAVADLAAGDGGAAERDVAVVGEALLERGRDLLLVGVRAQRRGDRRGAAVAARGAVARPRRSRAARSSCAATSAARAGSLTSATTPGEACAPVACSIRASARAEPESAGGEAAVGLQRPGDRAADHAGDDDEEHDGEQRSFRVGR